MAEEYHRLTEKGILTAMEMHQKVLDGWTIEQVASYHEVDTLSVQVLLSMFYYAADQVGVDLGVATPDTIEGLDTDS